MRLSQCHGARRLTKQRGVHVERMQRSHSSLRHGPHSVSLEICMPSRPQSGCPEPDLQLRTAGLILHWTAGRSTREWPMSRGQSCWAACSPKSWSSREKKLTPTRTTYVSFVELNLGDIWMRCRARRNFWRPMPRAATRTSRLDVYIRTLARMAAGMARAGVPGANDGGCVLRH